MSYEEMAKGVQIKATGEKNSRRPGIQQLTTQKLCDYSGYCNIYDNLLAVKFFNLSFSLF